MAFLTLNGWTIPVRDAQARGSKSPHGGTGPSWSNRPNRSRRGLPREWRVTTVKMDPADADTLEGLAEGRGYRIPLDDNLVSTNGLPPQGGVGTIAFNSPGISGRNYLTLSAGTVIWNPGFHDGKWTVMYWRDADLGRVGADYVVVRGDGAKWLNGVRNDVAVTSELTVSSGTAAFGVQDYDDIVLLPFNASNDFIEAWTDKVLNLDMFFYAPLGEGAGTANVYDLVDERSGTLTGGTAGVAGQVGTAVEFANVLGDGISFAASSDWSASTRTALSVECWVKVDALPTVTRFVGNVNAAETAGWDLRPVSSGSGWALQGNVIYGGTNASSEANLELAFGSWHHVLMTWSTVDDTIVLYIDGAEPTAYTAQTAGTSGVTTDTSLALYIADDATAGNRTLDGTIDNVAMCSRVLTSADASASYVIGAAGERYGLTPTFSDMPRLSMSGDIIGTETIEVVGRHDDANVLGYGSSSGWVTNAREVSVTLSERKAFEHRLVHLDEVYVLRTEYSASAGNVSPVIGRENLDSAVGSGVVLGGALGPFGHGYSSSFDNTANASITLSQNQVERMTGKSSFSCVAWVRRAASGATDQVLCLAAGASAEKVQLWFTASDLISIAARPDGAGGSTALNATTSVTDTDWHMVGGVVDVNNDVLEVYLDGELDNSSTPSFTPTVFDEDAHTSGHYIGLLYNGTSNPFNGDIAMVGWAHRRLSSAEMRAIYNRGLKGWFR